MFTYKNFSKKLALTLTAGLLAIGLLAGCGSSGDQAKERYCASVPKLPSRRLNILKTAKLQV